MNLQEEKNEKEARERQHNQIIIQNQQMQVSAKSSSICLVATAGPDLGFVAAKTVVYYKWIVLGFVSKIVFNLFLLFTKILCFSKVCSTSLAKYRSIRSQMFLKIGALKNFANFTGKHMCWSLSFWRSVSSLKRDS